MGDGNQVSCSFIGIHDYFHLELLLLLVLVMLIWIDGARQVGLNYRVRNAMLCVVFHKLRVQRYPASHPYSKRVSYNNHRLQAARADTHPKEMTSHSERAGPFFHVEIRRPGMQTPWMHLQHI
jgi:hypothetical protein